MTVVRRFLLASSLARLIARDRGSTSITEGYFAGQQGQLSYVALDAERAGLVLTSEPTGSAPVEERTEIPRAHAEALLDVCAGRLTLERSTFPIDGGAEVLIERIAQPGGINTVTVEFHNPDEAQAFTPPPWFGPEITTEPSFGRQVIALDRLPELPEVPLSNAIIEAVLDLLEGRASTSHRLLRMPRVHRDVGSRRPNPALRRRVWTPDSAARSTRGQPRAPDARHERTAYAPGTLSEAAERDKVHPVDSDEPPRPSTVRPAFSRD